MQSQNNDINRLIWCDFLKMFYIFLLTLKYIYYILIHLKIKIKDNEIFVFFKYVKYTKLKNIKNIWRAEFQNVFQNFIFLS